MHTYGFDLKGILMKQNVPCVKDAIFVDDAADDDDAEDYDVACDDVGTFGCW